MENKPIVLGLVGPTASGKTALSLLLAREYPLEIVCMDSMQVYRGMDIGTAKPTPAERASVAHHMLDLVEPREEYSVAQYREAAAAAIAGIIARGRLPLLVGGTGLYLRALSLPMELGNTKKDQALRLRYEAMLHAQGPETLHALLHNRDPASAARLHPNDSRRVIRALEIGELTGQPMSAQRMPEYGEGPYDIRLFAMDLDRALLYRRIGERVDAMMAQGLLGEVRALAAGGLTPAHQSMQGLGYKELLPCVSGGALLPEAVELLKRRTRNYAKRQLTWFRKDGRVTWLKRPDEFLPLCRRAVEDR